MGVGGGLAAQRTIHCIGDLHAGGIKRPRVSAMLDDVKTLGTPAIHLQIGDSTERDLPEEDVLAKRWLGRLPARHYTVLGNHDVLHNKRTPSSGPRPTATSRRAT